MQWHPAASSKPVSTRASAHVSGLALNENHPQIPPTRQYFGRVGIRRHCHGFHRVAIQRQPRQRREQRSTKLAGSTSGKLDNPTRSNWFDPTAFAAPSTPRFGNAGREILYSPGTVDFDLSAAKNFAITERFKLQFRVDAFNALNHPQFGFTSASIAVDPVTRRDLASSSTSITSTIADNRDLQLALKLYF